MDTKSAPIWRTPLIATLSTGLILLGLFLYSPYGGTFYLFIIAPLTCLILFSLLLGAAISKKGAFRFGAATDNSGAGWHLMVVDYARDGLAAKNALGYPFGLLQI